MLEGSFLIIAGHFVSISLFLSQSIGHFDNSSVYQFLRCSITVFVSLFGILASVSSSVFVYCTVSHSVSLAVGEFVSPPISQLVKLLVISPLG